jgi:predicted membrane channel-forming protein YqfA (hemolysin III family)
MKYLFHKHSAEIINHLFQTLLITYLILLLAEQIWPGVVTTYLNLNFLLIIVIASGILDVFSYHPPNKQKPITPTDYIFIIILGILGFAIIKFKTADLAALSWIISSIAGILIILLSILILEENQNEKP